MSAVFPPYDVTCEAEMLEPLDFNRRSRLKHVDKVLKAVITNIIELTAQEKLFHLRIVDDAERARFSFLPGQFVMVEVPGFGEVPISISSSASQKGYIELCIRDAGLVTGILHRARRGSHVGLRGPFGTHFPMEEADFLGVVEVVAFREVASEAGEDYDIAFVEGAISRPDEVARLEEIRSRAGTLVAFGSCACFGGVNRLKNACDLEQANREVYGDLPKETLPVRAVGEVVAVDLEILGCPVSKLEVERIVQHLIWGVPFRPPSHPVCVECKRAFTVCIFDRGEPCLGPITRAGCGAPCPRGGLGCYGCRGPAVEANIESYLEMTRERGFDSAGIEERLAFFGGFANQP